MKHFVSIIFIFLCLSAHSQEKHFMFIQSEDGQPFLVSINGKLMSSSATGYIIIPKLAEGSYNFSIGFAKDAFPEQTFQYSVSKKDLGFNLKNFGDKGWGLFNLQSLDVTMATAANTNNVARALSENSRSKQTTEPVISFDKKKEPSIAKADATQSADAVPNEQIIKKEELNSLDAKKDTASANSKSSSVQNMPVVTDPPIPKESVVTDVKKVSEVKTEEGVYLSYSQKNGKNSDTVHVIIPSAPSSVSSENAGVASEASSKKDAVAAAPVASQSGKDEIKFLDVDPAVGKKKPVAEGTDKQENITKQDNTTLGNSNCKNVATDDDFTKLKRKMSMQTSDEKMIGEARKVYRLKCFTTSQIKGLSTLFLSDEGRLKFFDASYLSVADASLYATLQSEFIDPAYLQRFKALLQ